ncbi:tubulin-tyrosine ligase/Tubulin polyglutamylase [Kipferlia bialata]|uniref:Tubulin--tyrosine ligase-like protein 5 n=1 Tax=Kipferlia bialata TaxID=797122 RepID=A0A9K3CQS1_9EUKA|nr:tubulin-tyrosine ligase/Tubulin polyglutamylase [Kipferlia bialata]|eukprot:g583.t1
MPSPYHTPDPADLRVYCLVVSVAPLVVYILREGLVRVATERYTPLAKSKTLGRSSSSSGLGRDATSDSMGSHLTNTSLAKGGKGGGKALIRSGVASQHDVTPDPFPEIYPSVPSTPIASEHSEGMGVGMGGLMGEGASSHRPHSEDLLTKGTFKGLAGMLGEDVWEGVWADIRRVCAATLSVLLLKGQDNPPPPRRRGSAPVGGGFMELFGLDVLLTSQLRPYILEANASPSLKVEGMVDYRVKGGAILGALDICRQIREGGLSSVSLNRPVMVPERDRVGMPERRRGCVGVSDSDRLCMEFPPYEILIALKGETGKASTVQQAVPALQKMRRPKAPKA